MNKSIKINNLSIFYREAGEEHKETILLLHGNPTSSHMYKNLMNLLKDNYHVIAPDYPGYGFSDRPSVVDYEYSFDNISNTINQFIDALNLKKFYLFVQDYGGPIGFRIATLRPQLIKGLIIQNANMYIEGLGEWALKIGQYMQNNEVDNMKAYKKHLVSLEGLKEQYITGTKNPEKIDPDSYFLDYAFLQRSNSQEAFLTLFDNYSSNFEKYEEWQNYLKNHQPPMLIVWGTKDKFFNKQGAQAYAKDVKNLETHFFDGGHFMLEEYYIEVAQLIKKFI